MTVHAPHGEAWRRVTIAGAIVALHIAFAIMLIHSRRSVHAAAGPSAILVRIIPAIIVPPPIERDAPIDVALTAPQIDIAESGEHGVTSCDVLGDLGRALQNDPDTLAALAATAAGPQRSIMAWNGGWAEQPETYPLHRAADVVLRAIRAECLDEPTTGPRLLFLPIAGTTVTIAFGSGSWTWRELLSKDH